MHNKISRSTLYNLEPMGLGTPYIEGMNSYLSRLAVSHNISIRSLLQYIIYPQLEVNYYEIINKKRNSKFLNGNDSITIKFIDILEKLTTRKDLSYLTLKNWRGITNKNTLSCYRKWCPYCLNEMKNENNIIYHPLLWSINCIQMCTNHKVTLSCVCHLCGKLQYLISNSGGQGICYSCKAWLGLELNDKVTNDNSKDNEFEYWMANSVGEMLKNSIEIFGFPLSNIYTQIVKDLDYLITDEKIKFLDCYPYLPSTQYYFTYDREKTKDPFYKLLAFIYTLGAPIRILYDYSSIDLSSLEISKNLEVCKNKYLRNEKLKKDFSYLIDNYYPFPNRDEIIQLTGDKDELLIEHINKFIEGNDLIRKDNMDYIDRRIKSVRESEKIKLRKRPLVKL